MRVAVALVAGALLLTAPSSAHAWERSQGFGVDVGMGALTLASGNTSMGVALGLHYSLALTDELDLVGEFGGAIVDLDPVVVPYVTPLDQPQFVWNTDVGILYKLDLAQFVPYFGGLIGGYVMNGGSMPSAIILPGAELAVGADYLLTRRWAVGLSIREHIFPTDMGTFPSYLTVTGRVEVNWGQR